MDRRSTCWAVLVMLLSSCLFGTMALASEEPIHVFVSILPQKYFVERIGGDRVSANVLVGPGLSPATYEPTPKQMASLSQADVFFRIGVPFENRLLEKIKNMIPDLNVADTRIGIPLISIQGGDQHVRDPNASDPHIWMDPKRAGRISSNITEELIRIDPEHAEFYRMNLVVLRGDLDQLDAKIRNLLKTFQGRSFMVFHPSYGYFAESYGLNQIAVEHEGKSPGPKQVAQWIDRARKEKVRFIFVQPQFSRTSAVTIGRAVGATVLPVDPLAENYIENLETIAKSIQRALTTK